MAVNFPVKSVLRGPRGRESVKLDNIQEGYADMECFGIIPVFKVNKVNVIKMIPEIYDHIGSTWRDELRLGSPANVVNQVFLVNKVKKAI